MANLVCLLAARAAKASWNVRELGAAADRARKLRVYASMETRTRLHKAADFRGRGAASIRWIAADMKLGMKVAALRRQIEADALAGDVPYLVVGTSGSVISGAVDPLLEIAGLCREYGAWFHVDGAYGGLAACVPEAPT